LHPGGSEEELGQAQDLDSGQVRHIAVLFHLVVSHLRQAPPRLQPGVMRIGGPANHECRHQGS
jgi:hypothetical protein